MVLTECVHLYLQMCSFFQPHCFSKNGGIKSMEPKKRESVSRRKFVKASAGVVAAGTLLGKRAFAAPRPLKIGYVSSETGALASFGEADPFVLGQIRKNIQGGIQ